MAKTYAQFAATVFLIAGVAGFFTGDASRVVAGSAGGNFAGVTLHLTYTRDVLNLVLAGVFAYAGFIARDADAWLPLLGAAVLLLVLAVVGFIHVDNAAGSNGIATLHFPLAINVLDLVAGTLTLLCAVGDRSETAEPRRQPEG